MKYIVKDRYETFVFEASNHEEASEFAVGWVRKHYDSGDRTFWVDVQVISTVEPKDTWTVSVQVDPKEPPCSKNQLHLWGDLEVCGSGGGVITVKTCSRCKCKRTLNTWATRSDTGEQGFVTTHYKVS